MAKVGFGKCELAESKHEYKSAIFERQCEKFNEVAGDVKDQRVVWMNGASSAKQK